ncbi:type II secretion system protein GspM [Variovorax sp. AFSI2.2]|uniref:type II secretion system protein GspM n=1 Tax=Variovorax sp. AFSI2.2 TaxID=3384160 RepID=UPI003EBD0285
MKHLQFWWKGLSRRDQRLLAAWFVGMAVAALVWFWFALASAQEQARAQWAAELKALGVMRVQADELRQIKQLPAAGSNVKKVHTPSVIDSLSRFGLPTEIIQTLDAQDQVGLQGLVPFDQWLEWVAFVQKDMRLVVQKAKVTRTDRPGIVEIQATLALGKD